MIENKVNGYGQEQIINNFDKIIKIDNNFLQVRLIKTKKWKERNDINGKFTELMPRARFVDSKEIFYYLISKKDLIQLKNKGRKK